MRGDRTPVACGEPERCGTRPPRPIRRTRPWYPTPPATDTPPPSSWSHEGVRAPAPELPRTPRALRANGCGCGWAQPAVAPIPTRAEATDTMSAYTKADWLAIALAALLTLVPIITVLSDSHNDLSGRPHTPSENGRFGSNVSSIPDDALDWNSCARPRESLFSSTRTDVARRDANVLTIVDVFESVPPWRSGRPEPSLMSQTEPEVRGVLPAGVRASIWTHSSG